MKPYTDDFVDNCWIRTFDVCSTDTSEYIWHRDLNSRKITILEGEGWQFQLDNEMPKQINSCDVIFVPKMAYHRLLRGHTNLKIWIEEVH